MFVHKSSLYLLLAIACLAGYIWVFINYDANGVTATHSVCLIKNATNIPCPSCGSTRSVVSLVNGDLKGAITHNPLGIFLVLILLITPFWLLYDVAFQKDSLFKFYRKFEVVLQQKHVAIPAIAMVMANWAWNIYKGL